MNSLIKRELHPTTFSPLLSTTALALILSACGGGGGGGGTATPAPTTFNVSGRLYDGPISGAKIYIDVNDNGEIDDADLLIGTTDSLGAYARADIPNAHKSKNLIADLTDAVDIGPDLNLNDDSDNEDVSGIWLAPAGSKVISPLTHYIVMNGDITILEHLTADQIKTRDPFDGQPNDDIDNRIKTLAEIVADQLTDPNNLDNADILNIATLSASITTQINSENKVPTAMALSRATRPLNEGPHKAIHLADVTFTDNDGLGTLEIALSSSGNDHNTYFEIRDTGDRLVKQLWLKSDAPIDYETAQIHVVTLTGSGSGSNSGTIQPTTFTLNINNIHDEAPDLEIETNSANLRIGSTSQSQTTSTGLTFKLTDADGGEVKADGFEISSDDSLDQSGKFDIEAIDSNDLTAGRDYRIVAKSGQNFDNTPITLKVSYRDVGGQSDEITFATITPSDGPTRPVITSDASFNIDENTISIDTLSADGGGSITWSITGGDDRANFNLTSAGVLTFTGPSNQDVGTPKPTHTVIVTASNTAGTSAPQTITVTINNIDEGDAAFEIAGTPRAGQSLIARLTTADHDGVTDAGYSYQWYRTDKDGNTSQIQNATNVIYRLTTADEDHTISVKITYRDKSVTGQTTDTVVTSTPSAKIPITPVITTTDTTPAIDENDTSTSIAVLVGLDLENDTPVTWSVSDTTNFAIDTNGALTFIGSSDQDVTSPTSSYPVTITATSTADNTLTDTADITLTINEINDEDHHLTRGGNAGRLSTGTIATDTDTGLTFTFRDADNTIDESLFSINSDDFEVVAANNNAIKDGRLYKIQTSAEKTFTATAINLTVTYDDSVRPSKTVTFAEFTPTDAITTPVFTSADSYRFDENNAYDIDAANDGDFSNDFLVTTLSATGGSITWSKTAAHDSADFRLNTGTGQLYFVGKSDQEANNPTASYQVTVTATNTPTATGTPITVTQTITLRFNNINDEDPTLATETTTANLAAGADTTNRDTGLTFTVTDADKMFEHDGFTITGDQSGKFDIKHVSTAQDEATYKIIAKMNQDIKPTGITLTIAYNDGINAATNTISFGPFTPTIPAALDGTANNGLATAAGQTFTGSPYNDDDLVSFAGSTAVTINLGADSHSRGFAQGATLTSIEHIIGSPQADNITGNADANIIRGGAGGDTLKGGEGDDIIEGGAGGDTINGGAGIDTVSYENAGVVAEMFVNLTTGGGFFGVAGGDSYISIENIIGSNNNDQLHGNDDNNHIAGGDGNDLVDGKNGNDVLEGGEGTNALRGARGNDIFVLGANTQGKDYVQDFNHTSGGQLDKIRVDTANGNENTIAAIRTALNLRITNGTEINDHADITSNPDTNDESKNDTIIYDTNSTSSDTSDDQILMVLLDFTETLTIDMFDII